MDAKVSLGEVIGSYDSWRRPWEFHDYVADAVASREDDRALFEGAWLEATDAGHWTSPDLDECCRRAEVSLRRQFPALSAEGDLCHRQCRGLPMAIVENRKAPRAAGVQGECYSQPPYR